jgi:hypothetical protein
MGVGSISGGSCGSSLRITGSASQVGREEGDGLWGCVSGGSCGSSLRITGSASQVGREEGDARVCCCRRWRSGGGGVMGEHERGVWEGVWCVGRGGGVAMRGGEVRSDRVWGGGFLCEGGFV